MKKFFLIVATMALTFSVAASVHAAEENEASAQAACTHSAGTTEQSQKTYTSAGDQQHNIYLTYLYYCNSCGAVVRYSGPYPLGSELHDFEPEKYMGSNHSGNYSEHYYTYRKACRICGGAVERRGKTGCTAKKCIEPQ